jgi:hypothetical protein
MSATAKTVVELFIGTHRKRRRFFLMERTQTGEVAARFFKLHALANHFHHVNAAKQVVNKTLWNLACHELRASSREALMGGPNVIRQRA